MWDEQFAAFAKTYKVIRYDVVNEDVGDPYSKPGAKVDEVFRVSCVFLSKIPQLNRKFHCHCGYEVRHILWCTV